ncbi:hypothetical protein SELMODRAFT_408048 [Selaginella moellendorffii]|uniref:Uncharacterized protein n=1 Tax=Selaginella moellendorffii TaxID=88036 RepID=D8R714_SELML|nr:uncharacterized protein LOC9634702 [Selaginella moellendorffii]EFJ31809.1 hypothetical protein SELMODRAFT_408048 [Selaginella moellendorffii]|eukprot:XP_002967210.1 uncharacterized protein LOC9634702 [Selaginella moellendorffii]
MKKRCCDTGEECAKALKVVERHKTKNKGLPFPVSNAVYKALHTLKEGQVENEVYQRQTAEFRHYGPWTHDEFACDKEAYELFVVAMEEEGRPLGLWVKRMLDEKALYTDVNYLEKPGWQDYPSSHFCDKGREWVFGRIGIADEDAQERMFPSLLSYVRANLESRYTPGTVFVTGNREFYEKVLLDEDRMGLLVETFLERHRIICKPRDLMRRVWFVSKDQKAINNVTDEVCIRVPRYAETSVAFPRKPDMSDFLPNELALVSAL